MVGTRQLNMKIIDPHLHLFDRKKGQYPWLSEKNPPFWHDKSIINRDFNVIDLRLDEPFEHCGFVHIEAGFDNLKPWREIQWIESLTGSNIRTVACVDLTLNSHDFVVLLDQLSIHKTLCGVRHILDGDAQTLLNTLQVQTNISTIAQRGLIFECQLDGEDTAAIHLLSTILKQNLNLKLVINHAAFPKKDLSHTAAWFCNMQKLALFSQVKIKASGWEMVDRSYNSQQIQTVVELLIRIFSIDRVMLASNFPLCLFSQNYQSLWHCYSQLDFSDDEIHALTFANALKCYHFSEKLHQ